MVQKDVQVPGIRVHLPWGRVASLCGSVAFHCEIFVHDVLATSGNVPRSHSEVSRRQAVSRRCLELSVQTVQSAKRGPYLPSALKRTAHRNECGGGRRGMPQEANDVWQGATFPQFWEHNDEHTPTQTSSCRPPCSKRHPQAFQQTDLIRASIHQAPLSPEPST